MPNEMTAGELEAVEKLMKDSFAFNRNSFRPNNFFGNCFAMDDCIALAALANAAPLMVAEIKRLRAELAGAKAVEWQPIETAPKDNSMILVHGGVAHWWKGEWYTLTAEEYPGRPIQWKVAHWMPLPSPPPVELRKSATQGPALSRPLGEDLCK